MHRDHLPLTPNKGHQLASSIEDDPDLVLLIKEMIDRICPISRAKKGSKQRCHSVISAFESFGTSFNDIPKLTSTEINNLRDHLRELKNGLAPVLRIDTGLRPLESAKTIRGILSALGSAWDTYADQAFCTPTDRLMEIQSTDNGSSWYTEMNRLRQRCDRFLYRCENLRGTTGKKRGRKPRDNAELIHWIIGRTFTIRQNRKPLIRACPKVRNPQSDLFGQLVRASA